VSNWLSERHGHKCGYQPDWTIGCRQGGNGKNVWFLGGWLGRYECSATADWDGKHKNIISDMQVPGLFFNGFYYLSLSSLNS
jgi:hypothetical protein